MKRERESTLSSGLNKGNKDRDGVSISDLLAQIFTSLFFRFLPSFSFDWEGLSNTQDSFWQQFQSLSKILCYTSYFQFPSPCLELMCSNTVFRVWDITSKNVERNLEETQERDLEGLQAMWFRKSTVHSIEKKIVMYYFMAG